MGELNPQFYDQLAERLNRQDTQLDRIEGTQDAVLSLVRSNQETQTAHIASDKSNFKWITWVLGGVWAALATLFGFTLNH